jgi:hypothetical protein
VAVAIDDDDPLRNAAQQGAQQLLLARDVELRRLQLGCRLVQLVL